MVKRLKYWRKKGARKWTELLFFIKTRLILPLGLYDKYFLNLKLDAEWEQRISDVVSCADNSLIDRHPLAGTVLRGTQIMHNGIKITLGGYYGEGIVQMLQKNKGVHEPQEEYAFDLVLKTLPEAATMVELGSYWSFYSIWFNLQIKKPTNFMIEPEHENILYGMNNFRLNGATGKFINASIGATCNLRRKITSVDEFCRENQIEFIDILHSDIQGFEYDMLLGCENSILSKKIRYFFISTHGNEIHYKCLDFLVKNNFEILCHADESETYSYDGLIVAKSTFYPGLSSIKITKKRKPQHTSSR